MTSSSSAKSCTRLTSVQGLDDGWRAPASVPQPGQRGTIYANDDIEMSEGKSSSNDAIDASDIGDTSGLKNTTSAPSDKMMQLNESVSSREPPSLNPDKTQRTGTKGKRTIHKRSTRLKVGRKVNKNTAVAITKETSQTPQLAVYRREHKIAKRKLKRQTRQMERALAGMCLDLQPAPKTTVNQTSRSPADRKGRREKNRKSAEKTREKVDETNDQTDHYGDISGTWEDEVTDTAKAGAVLQSPDEVKKMDIGES